MSKPKKNRSARDKRIARQRRQRRARRADYPLYRTPPPFKPYQEWIDIPRQAEDMIEHPGRYDDRLDASAKDLLDTLVKLGPRYQGHVPMAAVHLDHQMQNGFLAIAVTGNPDRVNPLPLAELAATTSSQDRLDEARLRYPEAGLPERATLTTDDAAAWSIHQLHRHGFLILDDDLVLNMAIPPRRNGDRWLLNGHDGPADMWAM